ncbi:very long-chain-fatty-acid--CoA ligase bubblegum-like [Phymastichus coffea]|uniref:very long-chain-fatty-acid--CoA ligase bubblegum-like n=1 Tax=Phymastichus coffea TaxID=108790 RepID=UPI00273CE2BB|nr:very long-chain-fatty-acid--CoA ligase bubblegum-like [Phymastichus coffea]
MASTSKDTSAEFPGQHLSNLSELDGPDQILYAKSYSTWEPHVSVVIDRAVEDTYEPVSIPGLLTRIAKEYPDQPALISRPNAKGERTTLTYKEYENQVRIVAKAFLSLGLQKHHSVCILGFNSPEWIIADIAAIYAGGFATGIYATNSAEACQYCAENSRATIAVVEDNNQVLKILQIKKYLPKLKTIIQYDGVPKINGVLSWSDLLNLGKQQADTHLRAVMKTIGINECCTLVYTSGTVGNPKAVMLSHDNLLADAHAIMNAMKVTDMAKEVFVSFLPLSHVAAQVVDIYLPMMTAGTVYVADRDAIKGGIFTTLVETRPTFFLGVPRVWEKLSERMKSNAHRNNFVEALILNRAKVQGLKYHMDRMEGVDNQTWGYQLAKRMVFDKIKRSLGLDRCRIIATAAAPLSTDIKKYFLSLDIVIIDAYGLTECSGAHTTTTNKNFKLASVGLTLPTFSTKLYNVNNEDEGEICMSGRHIFMGYLNDPQMTMEAKDKDNWLHSGDIGRMDSKGFLYITGRIKEIVITAGGENIPPVRIEQLIKQACPAISNAMLIGDGRKYLTVLLTFKTKVDLASGEPLDNLSEEAIRWAACFGSHATTVTQIIETQDPHIDEGINKTISRVNEQALSHAQRVQKFCILPRDFSVATGELGPTLKLKRDVVAKKYHAIIEAMYRGKQ